jgi:Mn2+/Fe2+ NRAMP family transporter
VLRLVNDRELMGKYTNSRLFNILSYGTTAILILLTIALIALTALGIG